MFISPELMAACVISSNVLLLFFYIGVSFGESAVVMIGNSVGRQSMRDIKIYGILYCAF